MVSPDEYRSDQTSVALGKFETNNAAAYGTVLSTNSLPTQFNKQYNCLTITRAFLSCNLRSLGSKNSNVIANYNLSAAYFMKKYTYT